MRSEEWQRQTEQITITKQSGVGEQNSAPLLLSHFTTAPRKERGEFAAVEFANKKERSKPPF